MFYSPQGLKKGYLQDFGPVTVKKDSSEETYLMVVSLVRDLMDSNARMSPFLFHRDTGGNGTMRQPESILYPLGIA